MKYKVGDKLKLIGDPMLIRMNYSSYVSGIVIESVHHIESVNRPAYHIKRISDNYRSDFYTHTIEENFELDPDYILDLKLECL